MSSTILHRNEIVAIVSGMRTITPYEIIYARVDPKVRKLLDRLAHQTDRTITAVLERAIKAAWKEHEEQRRNAS